MDEQAPTQHDRFDSRDAPENIVYEAEDDYWRRAEAEYFAGAEDQEYDPEKSRASVLRCVAFSHRRAMGMMSWQQATLRQRRAMMRAERARDKRARAQNEAARQAVPEPTSARPRASRARRSAPVPNASAEASPPPPPPPVAEPQSPAARRAGCDGGRARQKKRRSQDGDLEVRSSLRIQSGLYSWERELLLPFVSSLVERALQIDPEASPEDTDANAAREEED